eukprot:197274-Prymnesium_polylepis.1
MQVGVHEAVLYVAMKSHVRLALHEFIHDVGQRARTQLVKRELLFLPALFIHVVRERRTPCINSAN